MAGPSWLVDSNRIATKIKSASGASARERVEWNSNPSRACPNCQYLIDNSDVVQEWPGLPRGVKFDPSDQEIIWHLLAKVGTETLKPHPFIDEFIPTVNEDEGICYTHPQKLPGVKQDGSVSHFFHRAIKAYNTGTRKRRKISNDDFGDVRWHKTGRTKPVILDGIQRGCKKIMVLYMSCVRGGRAEKTNWVMHQYHLGTEEDEKDREYVVSKIFYQQQQQIKQTDLNDQDFAEMADLITAKVAPVTPKSSTPDPPCMERRNVDCVLGEEYPVTCTDEIALVECEKVENDDALVECEKVENDNNLVRDNTVEEIVENEENRVVEELKWWEGESQILLDSQQLVEGLSLCDDLLQSQSPDREKNEENGVSKGKVYLSVYAQLGPEHLKKDLEECQNLVLDPANIELDTPPDFRLSQLDFGSQESFTAWGGKMVD